jgi:hypothetical protein
MGQRGTRVLQSKGGGNYYDGNPMASAANCRADKFCQSSPIVPGHEIIGHVAAVGDDVSVWGVGDRIGGAWHGGHDGGFHNCCVPWGSEIGMTDPFYLRQVPAKHARRASSRCATMSWSTVRRRVVDVCAPCSQWQSLRLSPEETKMTNRCRILQVAHRSRGTGSCPR